MCTLWVARSSASFPTPSLKSSTRTVLTPTSRWTTARASTTRKVLGIDEEQKMVVAIAFGKADESSSIFNVEPGRADLSESFTLHEIDVDL